MLKRLFQRSAPKQSAANTRLAYIENDDTISLGAQAWNQQFQTRVNYDREKVLNDVINAWRSNPIAKRIIEITTEFVIGDGFGYESEQPAVKEIIKRFWSGPLNDLDAQLPELADEAWRTGDLFILCSIDKGGMMYVRAIPAENIQAIEHAPNDWRQELYFKRNALDDNPYLSYSEWKKQNDPSQPFVLHFPLNRAVGASFGESDLASVLYWIRLYRQFLEDRARRNFFLQLYTWIVQKSFSSQSEKDKYASDFITKLPTKSGGVLVIDKDEAISQQTPPLNAFDAQQDGLAIKRMIATGVQLPMHYLAEPESSTSTTADAAGTPTFRRFKSRQRYFKNVIKTIVNTMLLVYKDAGGSLPKDPTFTISAPDITERDNANLSLAVQRIVAAMAPLYNAKKITAREFMRLVYRFLAEVPPATIPDEDEPIAVQGGSAAKGSAPAEPGEDEKDAA